MTGRSTAVLLQQHQLIPVMTGRSTAVLLQQHQLIPGYSCDVNCCPVATTSNDFRLWLGCQLLSCCNNINWFPVIAVMSTAVLLWQQQQLISGLTGMSTVVLLQQHQLISGYSCDVNCCPVATTSTDFRLWLWCQLVPCYDSDLHHRHVIPLLLTLLIIAWLCRSACTNITMTRWSDLLIYFVMFPPKNYASVVSQIHWRRLRPLWMLIVLERQHFKRMTLWVISWRTTGGRGACVGMGPNLWLTFFGIWHENISRESLFFLSFSKKSACIFSKAFLKKGKWIFVNSQSQEQHVHFSDTLETNKKKISRPICCRLMWVPPRNMYLL